MRLLPLCLLLAVVGFLLSPFLLTAWLREQRGVDISGIVVRKEERVWHSKFENDITRSTMVTVSYFPPGRSWSATQTVTLPLERYDLINRGDILKMRYLLERNLPDYPLLHSLYRSGFLPVASVDGRSVFNVWQDVLPRLPVRLLCGVTALIFILWLWYRLKIPGALFVVVICFVGAIGATNYSEIPQPMPPLQGVVLSGKATVQNEWTIDKLFTSTKSTSKWSLDQPVQYVSLEFVPEGRHEPVVAADNIDAGSIPNLQVGQSLAVLYEQANPRSARLVAGTRTFWNKNLHGLMIGAVIWIVLGGIVLVLWGSVFRKLRS
jgi:hypothetical protein